MRRVNGEEVRVNTLGHTFRQTLFGLLILAFAAIGCYAVVSYVINQSKREIKDLPYREEYSVNRTTPYDFSDTNRVLQGIEQQLKIMNQIQQQREREDE